MTRFDGEIAGAVGTETYAPLSDAGNRPPNIHFKVNDLCDEMIADPPGAEIRCFLDDGAESSVVRIKSIGGLPIADVSVRVCGHPESQDLTTETIWIASALYWSWWRAEDMHGRKHE